MNFAAQHPRCELCPNRNRGAVEYTVSPCPKERGERCPGELPSEARIIHIVRPGETVSLHNRADGSGCVIVVHPERAPFDALTKPRPRSEGQ